MTTQLDEPSERVPIRGDEADLTALVEAQHVDCDRRYLPLENIYRVRLRSALGDVGHRRSGHRERVVGRGPVGPPPAVSHREVYLVAVFPANVYVAVAGVDVQGQPDGTYPYLRLLFQPVFVWLALWSTREPYAAPARRHAVPR